MKRNLVLNLIGILCAAFLLKNCGSIVPISQADDAVLDSRLIGIWQTELFDGERKGTLSMTIARYNQTQYVIEADIKIKHPFAEHQRKYYRGYISVIDSQRFFNAYIPGEDDSVAAFFPVAYHFTNDNEIVIRRLTDIEGIKLADFQNSDALQKFIKRNIDNPQLYSKPIHFIRQLP